MDLLIVATVSQSAHRMPSPVSFLPAFLAIYLLICAVVWLIFLNKSCWKFWASVGSRLGRKLPKALRLGVELNLSGERARHHQLRYFFVGLPILFGMLLLGYSVSFYAGVRQVEIGMTISFMLGAIYFIQPFQEFLLNKGYTRLMFDVDQTLAVQAARQAAD